MVNDWIYWGIFLTPESRTRLLDSLPPIPDGYKAYAEHMTIIYNDGSKNAKLWSDMCEGGDGKSVVLYATHYGVSDKAIAVKVSGFPTNNKTPHITIATSPIGKPVDSNKIEHWEELREPIFVSGTVKCVLRDRKKTEAQSPVRENAISGGHRSLFEQLASEVLEAEAKKVEKSPSDAQIKAGNYSKGHISVKGMRIAIENPAGSYRKYYDEIGNEHFVRMKNHYGYFNATEGKDGDAVDVFLGPNIDDFDTVFCVDQANKEGGFDETKVMLGFKSKEEAKKAYLSNYSAGWDRLMGVTPVSLDKFKHWLYRGKKQKLPFSQYS